MPSKPVIESNGQKALQYRRLKADKPDFLQEVTNYSLLGATQDELLVFFGVDKDTWLYWLKHSEELRDAIAEGAAKADARVARAMLRRAEGYNYTRQRLVMGKDGHANIVDLIEHLPPDPTAGKFWLENRRPDQWSKDRAPPANPNLDREITVKFVSAQQLPAPLNVTPDSVE
jgi:hypothetical protein